MNSIASARPKLIIPTKNFTDEIISKKNVQARHTMLDYCIKIRTIGSAQNPTPAAPTPNVAGR